MQFGTVISDINFDPFSSPYVLEKKDTREEIEDPVHQSSIFDDLSDKTLTDAVNELQIRLINNALKSAKHNQKIAAKKLGITYHQFRGLYRKLHSNID